METGLEPRQEISSMEPNDSGCGPEIVPEARRSPGLMLHPVTVWWTSCCFIVQYMYLPGDSNVYYNVFS